MIATICRKAHFNAAHRLHNPNWSDEKNVAVFGKCNSPTYHGHNFDLEVRVRGEVDPDTGFVMDLAVLGTLIRDEIEERRPFLLEHIQDTESQGSDREFYPGIEERDILVQPSVCQDCKLPSCPNALPVKVFCLGDN
mgnify:CR=1 FL=1